MFSGISGRFCHSQRETFQASFAPFRFLLHPLYLLKPSLVVVFSFHQFQSLLSGKSHRLVFSDFILFVRVDIGVAVEKSGCDAILQQTFNDGCGAWCTAGVEQQSLFGEGRRECEHLSKVSGKDRGRAKRYSVPSHPPQGYG